jgi:hypothetical protein
VRKNAFLRTILVTRDIKEAITKAGFDWRPYVLRAYCDMGMIVAESKGPTLTGSIVTNDDCSESVSTGSGYADLYY